MTDMVSTDCKHHSLPKLSTTEELSRRDSLSSSRTRDSGYNSDLDVAFSPVDNMDTDQHMIFTPLPSVVNTFSRGYSVSAKTFGGLQDLRLSQRANITSNPIAAGTTTGSKLPFSAKSDVTRSRIKRNDNGHYRFQSDLVTQDEEIEKWIEDNLPSHNRPKRRVLSTTSLSSASSCEIYTSTDLSDDEQEADNDGGQPGLTRSAVKTIKIIIRKVEVNLRYAAFMQRNGGNDSTGSNSNASFSHPTSRKAFQGAGKRKSRSDDHPPPNDDDDDGSNKRRRSSLATVGSSDSGARFACPFFKHEPNRYRNRRTCPGPGWPTVHRMKEHLYRAHAQSIYCPRCYTMFDADTDLSNHLRTAQCQVSATQPIEGIDRETLNALRKRSPALRLEEDKWRDVYRLLFPHVVLEDTPSPFYDGDSPSKESRRFRRELLRRVQQELVNTARQLPGPVEQQLLQQVAQIIQKCEEDLLSSFDTVITPVPSLCDRRTSTTSIASTISTQPVLHTATPAPPPGEASRIVGSLTPAQTSPLDTSNATLCVAPSNHSRRDLAPPVQLRPVPWDHASAATPSSEWIDWDAVFPPGPETACNEPFAGFSMPMWAQ